ncbi:FG-GAP repeat domain-containing protein [Micromonospora avicenniae]|uniref:FG-GAP repeat domain-containing protein n=1 Tax=Micromonospora avicenniae TaxID=1198245 RepID=UPI00343747B1
MGRSSAAGALATTLAAGLLAIPAVPAAADPSTAPREVAVIPEYEPTVRPTEKVVFAGATGFLHQHNNQRSYLWTRYDTGTSVRVNEIFGVRLADLRPAGGDTVAIEASSGSSTHVVDLADQTWETWAWPAEGEPFGIYGRTMVSRVGDTQLVLHTVDAEGNVTGSRLVTGAPAGTRFAAESRAGDPVSVVVPGTTSHGRTWYGLLDIATATVVPIPGATAASPTDFRLSGEALAWVTSTGTAHVLSRAGLTSGTDTAERVVTVAGARNRLAVLEDRVVALLDPAPGKTDGSVVTVALDGGGQTTVLPRAQLADSLLQGPDGTALAVGGTNHREWAVQRFTATGAAPAPVMSVRDPVENAGLTYRRGVVRHVQTQVLPSTAETQFAVFNHALAPDPYPVPEQGGTLSVYSVRCAPAVACVRTVDGVEGRTTFLMEVNGQTMVTRKGDGGGNLSMSLPATGARLVDAMDRFAVVDGGSPAAQYVVDLVQTQTLRTGPITAAALWFDTLWTTTGVNGQLRQVRLPGFQTMRTISTGAPCVPTEVQVGTRWLWWSCGREGPAGAFDLQLSRSVTLPSGPALLGDGFVVRHDTASASLQMIDFHDGVLRAPVRLADLPVGDAPDSRNISWAVDRQGDGVAYVDSDNAVHVLDTGVPSTPPQIGKAETNLGSNLKAGSDEFRNWTGTFLPSRPLSSWELTVTRKATGQIVARRSGGPVRDQLGVVWDGRLPNGEPAVNGGYRWTLNGVPAGGTQSNLGSGNLLVSCGTFPFRTRDCQGSPALLGVKANGEGHWYGDTNGGEPNGELSDNGYTDMFCLSCTGAERISALVPFGDYNGDDYPDLLVRDGNGGMKAHLGNGQLHGGSGTVSLGAGWMMYKSILAPGDVNSDGHDDILGIDADGRLWLYTTTEAGAINARLQVGSGWNMYTKVIGAGDLNGDGHGDLLGIDTAGVMYAYFSNGNRGWSARSRVFAGWNIYSGTVVPIGDLNQDGHNDLLARDANGLLWYYAGLGNGSFAARVQRGSGWNMYKVVV